MSTRPGPASRSAIGNTPRVYPPDLQPLLQSILAALADIDFVHASEVAIVRNSDADEWLKQSVIRRRHRQVVGEGYADPGLRLDQATVTTPVISVQAWNARARAPR
jgi:hypothetical protein